MEVDLHSTKGATGASMSRDWSAKSAIPSKPCIHASNWNQSLVLPCHYELSAVAIRYFFYKGYTMDPVKHTMAVTLNVDNHGSIRSFLMLGCTHLAIHSDCKTSVILARSLGSSLSILSRMSKIDELSSLEKTLISSSLRNC